MKNNKMMRAASGLMIATLLTTSMISGTFAKYTTQSDGGDSARVAKWGVNLGVSGSLYGDAYDGTNTIVENSGAATVKSSSVGDKVVAPGTKSEGGLHITLNGQPEVKTRLTGSIDTQNIYLKAGNYGLMVKVADVKPEEFTMGKTYYKLENGSYTKADSAGTDLYTLEDAVEVNDAYYPVVYKGKDATTNSAADSLDVVSKEIADKLGGTKDSTNSKEWSSKYNISKDCDANADLAALLGSGAYNISWEWAIDGTDGADTILGNLIASNDGATTVVVLDKKDNPSKILPITKADGLATVTDNSTDTVASLKTSLSIDLTVEQVD